ncbi:MAG: hypothetical protein WBG92_13815 [Thiohalocapsa sp.]
MAILANISAMDELVLNGVVEAYRRHWTLKVDCTVAIDASPAGIGPDSSVFAGDGAAAWPYRFRYRTS